MNLEDVGNNGAVVDAGPAGDAGFAELDRAFAEAAEMFGLNDVSGGSEFSELEAMIADTEFATAGQESGGISLLDIADGWQPESMGGNAEGWLDDIWEKAKEAAEKLVKIKAKGLIGDLLEKVRGVKKYAPCVPAVMLAVAAFKAGKWGTAVKKAFAAYACIKAK